MNTFQLTQPVLEGYKNEKLTEERVNLLTTQANEQINEISQNEALYNRFVGEVNAPKNVDNLILWLFFMSDEDRCCDYIRAFGKDFRDMIPISDLGDLLLYIVYLKKVEDIELDGFDYLVTHKDEGIEEVDQFSFTNIFLYIQKSKEVAIEF
ncbi:MAG: Unknown protein [uncultured Sulfurovum sp.]|uniref:Uncharacterized protein n=1 Tax=uncultured Sulfurovum sp. TaxID=269237 RepID=A0A6S6SI84_9BACT|nr:MAG: Unknown protein [uncultured Sulfurovum sp.]